MSDTYASASSMAMPGEDETDFNAIKPIWKQLGISLEMDDNNLFDQNIFDQNNNNNINNNNNNNNINNNNNNDDESFGLINDDYDDELDKESIEAAIDMIIQDFEDGILELPMIEGTKNEDNSIGTFIKNIDWSTYDFSNDEILKSNHDVDDNNDKNDDNNDTLTDNIDDFFKIGNGDDDFEDENNENDDNNNDNNNISSQAPIVKDSPILPDDKWVTPKEWINNPEFENHVNYDVWSKYDRKFFEENGDNWHDEDEYYRKTSEYLMKISDLYLIDHMKISQELDNEHYWDKVIHSVLLQEDIMKDPIPSYLTPDINRGVEYSDDIIEMKGKLTLHPKMLDPDEEYKDDIFTPNEELMMTNTIGSIREQYDWKPKKELIHEIEDWKVEKLSLVIEYVNHLAELKSTKDNIIVFEYKGQMRHLLGVRASMMSIAEECFPEVVDIRLETERAADKFDY
eukprot:gene13449-18033_t